MVNFNEKDINMSQVAKLSKLVGLDTKHEYRVYGLSDEGNPPILFSAQESAISADQEKTMVSFLATNGVDAAMEDVDSSNKKVYIGFRRDLRDNPEMCARFLETFVHFLEGHLDIPIDFKLGIPSFKTNVKA